ncbi:MAG: TrmH family RNA methyltransferase [Candidatus Paceibacterota bacterium]
MNIKIKKRENILILPDIRSVQNVGAIFRTADAVGIDKIYLIGYTPTPLDRFGKVRGDMAKSSLGAEIFVPWEYRKTLLPLLKKLKAKNFYLIAIEQDKNSIDYRKIQTRNKNVFIIGREVKGISKSILKTCDAIAEIPMRGKKESLNVSVATGIALYSILNPVSRK